MTGPRDVQWKRRNAKRRRVRRRTYWRAGGLRHLANMMLVAMSTGSGGWFRLQAGAVNRLGDTETRP